MQVYFEIKIPLEGTLDWRVIYVGSADSYDYDQILGSISYPANQTGE